MWAKYDVLRRPEIAYLMCQFGDRRGVEAVTRAFFADNYDTGRRLEPDARPQELTLLTTPSAR